LSKKNLLHVKSSAKWSNQPWKGPRANFKTNLLINNPSKIFVWVRDNKKTLFRNKPEPNLWIKKYFNPVNGLKESLNRINPIKLNIFNSKNTQNPNNEKELRPKITLQIKRNPKGKVIIKFIWKDTKTVNF